VLTARHVAVALPIVNNNPETMERGRRSFLTAAGWFSHVASFGQNAPRTVVLMLRSIAVGRERRRFHSPSALRCVSKHEGHAVAVLILRDARKRVRLCGSACACALLRMRTAEPAARRRTVRGHSHLTMSNSLSRSRGAFLRPGFATLLHSPRIEGWAERRETFGCSGTRWAYHDVARQAPSEAPCVP
jgi:hypothetical protein